MKTILRKWGKTVLIILFLIVAFLSGNATSNEHIVQTKVLGVSTHSTPIPTVLPTPTAAPIIIINNIILPTSTPTPKVSPTPTVAVSTPMPSILTPIPTPTPTNMPTQTVTPTATPTPTPLPQSVGITIDYAGEHQISTYSATIVAQETAWQAVQDAIGLANIQYKDYGGSLGIMITGFNGVNAIGNQYYDFQVNGVSSNVGVSSYFVQNHDHLTFVLTKF